LKAGPSIPLWAAEVNICEGGVAVGTVGLNTTKAKLREISLASFGTYVVKANRI